MRVWDDAHEIKKTGVRQVFICNPKATWQGLALRIRVLVLACYEYEESSYRRSSSSARAALSLGMTCSPRYCRADDLVLARATL